MKDNGKRKQQQGNKVGLEVSLILKIQGRKTIPPLRSGGRGGKGEEHEFGSTLPSS